ncbi:MAG: hypothetical protein D6758_06500 [Gammaproteobacteria bacterium]|nr:MAG: hypothetical protein D6758_06500 [Gammaproteobacteria bacterium]
MTHDPIARWLDSVAWPVCRRDANGRLFPNAGWDQLNDEIRQVAETAFLEAVTARRAGRIVCPPLGCLWVTPALDGWSGLWVPELSDPRPDDNPQRREWERQLQQEFLRALRYHEPLCIAQLDVENDSGNGYTQEWLQGQLRSTDKVWQIGPGHFRLILPETTADGGGALVQRIARELEKITRRRARVRWTGRDSAQQHYSELLRALEFSEDWLPDHQDRSE